MSFIRKEYVDRLSQLVEISHGKIPEERMECILDDMEAHDEYEIAYDILLNDIFKYNISVSFKIFVKLKFFYIYFYGKNKWEQEKKMWKQEEGVYRTIIE